MTSVVFAIRRKTREENKTDDDRLQNDLVGRKTLLKKLSARFFGERLKNEFWKINGLKRSRNLKYGVFAPKRCDLGKIF
jgi:hypothetical protein